MKIDPITFEVDPSGGTNPIYVWEAPVRVWHWLMAVAMFVMIITGFLIGMPMHSNHAPTWITYDFGYIRLVHFAAGLFFTALFIYRLYWVIVGNRYARMIFLPPLWSFKWWKGVFTQIAYYLFMRKSAPEYAGHNPLAQLAVWVLRVG
jgi:Ni/Fe-hydrogenase 1 B-type cytochrome subunit